ncbi:RidA family protein [Sulfurimonas sp.]|uniref:RidA family protein n=1 Tax=Sulfurimonas sp. TaxID=2022749 RepID=UPI0025D6FE09|nr:RidA family protein [Sulfurimonas sp.]
MEIKRFETKTRMSKAVIHGNTAYLCGQTGAGENITEQTKDMLSRVDSILESIGTHKSKILSATIYIKDMSLFSQMNAVWDDWVEEGYPPARACVEASMARDVLLVEVSIITAI